jgi:amidase
MQDLHYLTLAEVGERIRRRDVSPVEIMAHTLARIETTDGELSSFVTVLAEQAIAEARLAAEEIAAGNHRGPLHGVPVGIKDLCATRGVRTTCASRILAGWIPDFDATVVKRLAAAGAITIGKLNMTEFAGAGYHPDCTPPRNPWNTGHWPGLSSSGSGAATAAGLCYASLGTDTGGSIRFPSAACGLVGIKPTYGRVSRHGVIPLCDTLDHVGPMTRSVRDAAIVLGVLAGADADDPTTSRRPVPDYAAALAGGVQDVRIGFDEHYCEADVETDTAAAVRTALGLLEQQGAHIVPIGMPSIDQAMEAAVTIFMADAVAAHIRTWPERADDYGPCFRAFLEMGAGMSAADYSKAHRNRLEWRGRLAETFEEVDVIACPSMAGAAPPVEDDRSREDGIVLRSARFTMPYDVSGSPTISVPCGLSTEGLPLSLQLVARDFDEATLCTVAHVYEQATDWHLRHPPEPA